VRTIWLVSCCALLVSGCLLGRPDHFYALDAGRSQPLEARSNFAMQVNLRVTLPVMVDRSEMVLSSPGGVTILEHERWAAPLSEQFSSVLGQVIEARRQGVIVTSRGIAQPDSPTTQISVDVVQLSLQQRVGATLEVRWRMQRGSDVSQGREVFVAAAPEGNYAGLVQALDKCIGSLADRLVGQLPQ
jgi:uncharacterized lipoprotein YmbA